MTNKQILLISRCPPYPIHLGDRLIIWHLARELSARGYQIDLLAFAQFDSDFGDTAHYAHYFRSVQLITEPKRASLSYLKRVVLPHSRFPKTAQTAWSPEMWQAIEQRLHNTDYALVHLFGSVQVYEYYHAFHQKSVIITPYESFSLFLERLIQREGGWGNRGRLWIARVFERFMFVPYPHMVVLAQPDKDALLALNRTLNIHVISNGIDLSTFVGSESLRDEATLLFVGNYEYAPNVDAVQFLASTILPRVREQCPTARLWIVGNAPPPSVQALASDHITVTGFVPDLRPYLSQATAFVSPLRVGAGMKNKILEAMSMGLPVVATPISVDGIAVVDGESARVADSDHLADAVVRVLQDRTLQHRLAHNARALIESRYSWGQVAEQYEALYRLLS